MWIGMDGWSVDQLMMKLHVSMHILKWSECWVDGRLCS